VLSYIGKKGIEVRKRSTGSPYGWPQDTAEGALLALVASEHLLPTETEHLEALRALSGNELGLAVYEHRDRLAKEHAARVSASQETEIACPAGTDFSGCFTMPRCCHELNAQVRAMDAVKSGAFLGVPLLLAFRSALLGKSLSRFHLRSASGCCERGSTKSNWLRNNWRWKSPAGFRSQ